MAKNKRLTEPEKEEDQVPVEQPDESYNDLVGSDIHKEPGDTNMGDFGPDTTDPEYTNWVQEERAKEDK